MVHSTSTQHLSDNVVSIGEICFVLRCGPLYTSGAVSIPNASVSLTCDRVIYWEKRSFGRPIAAELDSTPRDIKKLESCLKYLLLCTDAAPYDVRKLREAAYFRN